MKELRLRKAKRFAPIPAVLLGFEPRSVRLHNPGSISSYKEHVLAHPTVITGRGDFSFPQKG